MAVPMPPVHEESEQFDPLASVIAGAALAVRRRLPYTAFLVAIGGIFIIQEGLLWPGFVAILICAYSAVTYGRSAVLGLALLAAAAIAAAATFDRSIPSLPGWLGPIVVFAVVGLAAVALRNARARADAAARRAAALEQEQATAARAAIAEERARIARELHDVVSHHVSVMVIQAGAAGKVIQTRPDLAQGALTAIEASGREAMTELRQLLGLMTPADDRLAPQPGLADLDVLIDAVRAAGQPVTLSRDDAEVPPSVDLTAYRVVQEGLTNALRYAPGAATDVDIRRDSDDLVVEVRNAAAPPVDPAVQGAGRGLLGLGERVRLHNGTLDTQRTLGGGFRLTARIPT
ncbi:sensor histidine kinase [Luedemannella flava]